MSLLMAHYHHTWSQAMRVPLSLAFALDDCHLQGNPWLNIRRASEGYIAQERLRLIEES